MLSFSILVKLKRLDVVASVFAEEAIRSLPVIIFYNNE
jgi:hypothetical protein